MSRCALGLRRTQAGGPRAGHPARSRSRTLGGQTRLHGLVKARRQRHTMEFWEWLWTGGLEGTDADMTESLSDMRTLVSTLLARDAAARA